MPEVRVMSGKWVCTTLAIESTIDDWPVEVCFICESTAPPSANPGRLSLLIASISPRYLLVDAALTTYSPLDKRATIESEVPVPGPSMKPPSAWPEIAPHTEPRILPAAPPATL